MKEPEHNPPKTNEAVGSLVTDNHPKQFGGEMIS
jgi:hypothetical protein